MGKIIRKQSTKSVKPRMFQRSFLSRVSFAVLIAWGVISFYFNDQLIPGNYEPYLNKTKTATALKAPPPQTPQNDIDNDKKEDFPTNTTTTKQVEEDIDDGEEDGSSSSSFTRYDGVAIVTKVLWPKDIGKVEQWICLINHAYNDKLKYDFIIFTTMPWSDEEIERVQKVAHPANLTVSMEGPSLEEQIDAMSEEERKFLFDRCNVENNTNITWFHHCRDGKNVANLGYSWQSEFRAYHIWTHPTLDKYKYMIWLDTDAYPGQTWEKDPMKLVVENDLAILYAGWPYGVSNINPFRQKMMDAYNATLCNVERAPLPEYEKEDAFFIYGKICGPQENGRINQIAGNHHITNLNVFRKDAHQQFLKAFTGDYRFSRAADDQLAVTIVPLMEQYLVNNGTLDDIPTKKIVWHEASHSIALRVAHHGMYDVSKNDRAPRRMPAFYNQVKDTWPGLQDRCGSVF